ncbi:MAG: hypothetical protein SPJ27_00215 [Candidatus Onthovivens sp.]|nr:hypothetical protein [Candidatus Onthovivens sp.]
MPEIQFFKSKSDAKVQLLNKVTDCLYIIKDRGNRARIYYDYDDSTRLEIGSLDNLLYCSNYEVNNNIIIAELNNFYKYTETGTKVILQEPFVEVEINKLVAADDGLYVIKKINSDNTCNLARIYKQQDLEWNEYF